MKLSVLAPVAFSLGLAACGGSDDDGPVVVGPDAASSIDAAPVACTVSTNSFGNKGAITPSLCVQDPGQDTMSASDDVIIMRAPLEAGSPFDELELDLFAGFGAFSNGFVTGTFPITGDELNWSTCGLCVFVNTNRTDPMTYEDDYLATGGTVTITAINGTLTGSVSNLTFEHVTLSQEGSTPAGDSCTTAVAGATFTAPIMPAMNKAGASTGHAVKLRRAR